MNHDKRIQIKTIKVDDAVHRIGIGKFQRQVLFATGTCFMADSLQVILVSILSRKLQNLWLYDDSTTSTIMSCLFIGATAGTLILGPLADKIGRKPVLLYSAGIIALFGLFMALCTNSIELIPVVLCVGIGIGGLTVPFDILAEFLPTNNRGYYLLSIKYFWTFGSMLAPLLAYVSFELADSWRLLCIISVVPSILSFISGMQVVPESPRWLVSKGRKEEALYVLRNAAEINGLDPYEVLPEGCELEDEKAESTDIMELFTPRWRKSFFTLAAIWACYCFSFYGAIITMTRIFDNEDDVYYAYEDGPEFDYFALFLSSTAELSGTAISIFIIDRIGRVNSLVLFFILGGLSVFSLCLVDGLGLGRWVVISLALVSRASEMGAACVTWVATVELLSTEILSTGHSAVNFAAKFGAFLSPFLVDGEVSVITIGIVLICVNFVAATLSSTLIETNGVEMGKAVLIEEARSMDEMMTRSADYDISILTKYQEMKPSPTF